MALFAEIVDLLFDDDTTKTTFSSASSPVSRRCFNEWCRSGRVEGAEQDADGTWTCSAEAWNAARRSKPKPALAPLRIVTDDEDVLSSDTSMRSTRRTG